MHANKSRHGNCYVTIIFPKCRKGKSILNTAQKICGQFMYCTEKHEYILFRFQPTVWICIETWKTGVLLHSHSVGTSRTPQQDSEHEYSCCLCLTMILQPESHTTSDGVKCFMWFCQRQTDLRYPEKESITGSLISSLVKFTTHISLLSLSYSV